MYQYVTVNAKGQAVRSDFTWDKDDWDFIQEGNNDYVYLQMNDRDGNIVRQHARLVPGSIMDVLKES